MNCLGKGNYGYFIAMLFNLSTMLTYGAWLAYGILAQFLQNGSLDQASGQAAIKYWSTELNWSEYFGAWNWALAHDVRIGAVGLLALLTAPLGWGLFLYHVYLIWVGMTTNESSKWEDWKDAIQAGLVFRSEKPSPPISGTRIYLDIEPIVPWPAFSNQQLLRCEDGRCPDGFATANGDSEVSDHGMGHEPRWKKVQSMQEVENLYDLGFWDNLKDILPST